MTLPGHAVVFDQVTLQFGDVTAIDSTSFSIDHGEFFSLLGPSGSGKTSCLRLIAGFERATSGHIYLNDVSAENLPPFRRDVNTVFQDYALFPHMTVLENVAYSLMIQKTGKEERNLRAQRMLEQVQLDGLGGRKPAELSGGQRQRVSLARALINQPKILLLDEPLGALDLKLREQMQEELKTLQRELGITFVYVTHDQQEALTMSDRIAVFNSGRIQQIGSPQEVYNHPVSSFVANFVGTSNLLNAEQAVALFGINSVIAIRPENIQIQKHGNAKNGQIQLSAQVKDIIFQGSSNKLVLVCKHDVYLITVLEQQHQRSIGLPEIGDTLNLRIDQDDIQLISEGEACNQPQN